MELLTLPLVLAVVLLELTVGGAFVLWLLDRQRQAPSGFVKLTASVGVGTAALATALVPALPRGDVVGRAGLSPGPLSLFGSAIFVVLALAIIELIAAFTAWPRFRAAASIAVLAGGTLSLLVAAVARPTESPYDVFALVALPIGALAVGGADGAMLLGHWYLVTPKLTTGPLRQAALIVFVAVVAQLLLFVVAFARGDISMNWDVPYLIATGIRGGVGILMTGVIAAAAWSSAKTNTQAATGLLYVGLGTVLAGEIGARVIFFLTGVAL
ncbi:MAG: hypothetical protein M3O91_05025 [Chloroflexota bacterium]|nr:hypothetical protein [Chloroflexota bacterium]